MTQFITDKEQGRIQKAGWMWGGVLNLGDGANPRAPTARMNLFPLVLKMPEI